MMRSEWEVLAEKLLFDFGKAILGKNAGGLIMKLLKRRGIDGARTAIVEAQDKQDPREYIGAAVRDDYQEIPEVPEIKIGDTIGHYTWNGSRWADNRS